MRTPGRCTNHESCWLANGGRDIWVPVGDDFVCPVCAEPLTAPPLQAISSRSMAVAAAASLTLVALAGGAGFGLVRAINFASHGARTQVTALHPIAAQSRTVAQQSAASHGATLVAAINPPAPKVAAPVPAPKATTPPPASPAEPAPTALASAAPPSSPAAAPAPVAPVAPRVAAAQPAPAKAAPSTVTASAPPATPARVAAQTPAPAAAPRAAPPQQVAQATPRAPEAPREATASPVPKPEVTQAGLLQKVPQPSAKEPAIAGTANPEASREADSSPRAPVRPVPISGPLPPSPHRVVVAQAITYGKPPGPEGESVDSTGRWRRHPSQVGRSGFLPGPGWSPAGEEIVSTATQPYAVAQGDGEEAAATTPGFDNGATVPSMQGDTEAAQTAGAAAMSGNGQLPALVPQMVPRFEGEAGAETAPQAAPRIVTQLTVPGWGAHMPADVPAERVDVAAADAIDGAPDAPIRLALLPPAAPAKLVVPEYPPVAEDLDQPGRVNVGCIITVRGEPADCSVTRRLGGPAFATAVLDWLHSGEVRYRPHLVRGRPVPEPRLYDVKFVP